MFKPGLQMNFVPGFFILTYSYLWWDKGTGQNYWNPCWNIRGRPS